jgi:CVNH domain-containing protein
MRYLTLVAAVVMIVLWTPAKSSATAMDNPPGSYQQTCKNISVRGDDLRARCKDVYGHYHDTVLDHADRCWGDISNNNGTLVCERNGAQPGGSYAQTCRDIRVRWNVLWARCETRDRRWMETSLPQFSQCRGDISNQDGQLRCISRRDWDRDRDRDRDRDHDGDDRGRRDIPRGSYAQTCRDIRTYGDDLRAVCETVNGQWVSTTLDGYDRCVGDIVNDDGRLECTRRGGRTVPAGSYSQTCRNIYVRGDFLRAQCQDVRGNWIWSQLNDWDDCRRGIDNVNGQLRCNR